MTLRWFLAFSSLLYREKGDGFLPELCRRRDGNGEETSKKQRPNFVSDFPWKKTPLLFDISGLLAYVEAVCVISYLCFLTDVTWLTFSVSFT